MGKRAGPLRPGQQQARHQLCSQTGRTHHQEEESCFLKLSQDNFLFIQSLFNLKCIKSLGAKCENIWSEDV